MNPAETIDYIGFWCLFLGVYLATAQWFQPERGCQ